MYLAIVFLLRRSSLLSFYTLVWLKPPLSGQTMSSPARPCTLSSLSNGKYPFPSHCKCKSHLYEYRYLAISSTTPPTKLASSRSSSSKSARSLVPSLHPRRSTSYPIYPRLALARSCVVSCARSLLAKVTSSEIYRQSLSLLQLTSSKPRSLPFFKFKPFSYPSFMYLLSEP